MRDVSILSVLKLINCILYILKLYKVLGLQVYRSKGILYKCNVLCNGKISQMTYCQICEYISCFYINAVDISILLIFLSF